MELSKVSKRAEGEIDRRERVEEEVLPVRQIRRYKRAASHAPHSDKNSFRKTFRNKLGLVKTR